MKVEKYIIDFNASILDAIKKIQQNENRAVFVLNDKKKVVGIISEGDVLRSLILLKDIRTTCKSIMKKSFYFQYKKDIEQAKKIFKKKKISIIPVLDKKLNLKQIITLDDIL